MVKKLRRKSIQDLGRDGGGSAVGDGKSEKMTNNPPEDHGETACDPSFKPRREHAGLFYLWNRSLHYVLISTPAYFSLWTWGRPHQQSDFIREVVVSKRHTQQTIPVRNRWVCAKKYA